MKQGWIKTLLLGALAMPASLMASMPGDSVGVKVVNGKSFVLYKLAKGDNLGKLSREYGVSVASLEELNSTTAATIQAGQILMVPSRTAAAGMSLKTVVCLRKQLKQYLLLKVLMEFFQVVDEE